MYRILQKNFLTVALLLAFLPGCSAQDGERPPAVEAREAEAGSTRPEIVFYYANETADTPAALARMDKVDNLLSRAWSAVPQGDSQNATRSAIDRERAFLKVDRRDFPAQIVKDMRGLERQICFSPTYRRAASLFIFSNKLARDGKFLFCLAGSAPGPLEQGEYPVALVHSALNSANIPAGVTSAFSDSPLLFAAGLRAARDVTQLRLAASGINLSGSGFTFIFKSHHGGSFSLTSRHAFERMPGEASSDDEAIQSLVMQGGNLPLPVAGITAADLAREVVTLSASPEVVILDHANTAMTVAMAAEVRSAIAGEKKDVLFIPSAAPGSYESVSWGNLPPAKSFADALRAVLRTR